MKTTWQIGNSKGIAILRVSSQRQKDGVSHDTQENEIREYCERIGIELVSIHKIIESAKDSEDRKKYRSAIDEAIRNGWRHICFYMYDRETRNLSDNERNEKLVKADLVCIHYVRENKVLYKESPDSEFFIRDVQAAANKQFVRNLSAKVGDAMLQKCRDGWFPGNKPPMGYIHVRRKDESGKEIRRGTTIGIDPNEKNIRLIKREFELRAQGHSLRDIRKIILAEGLVPEQKSRSYQIAGMDKRLKNPIYWGQFLWQGLLYQGKHELFIPRMHLNRVQDINEGKKLFKPVTGHGVFSGGFIKCATCGCNVVFDPKKKYRKHKNDWVYFYYYHCTNGKLAHASMVGMNISEKSIWEQLDVAVEAITIPPLLAIQIADELNRTHHSVTQRTKEKIRQLRAQIETLEQKEERVYDDLTRGVLDAEGFKRIINRVRRERDLCRIELEGQQGQLGLTYKETAHSTLELATHAKSLYSSRSPVERREFLERLVSNPTLDGLTLRYDLKKPFGVLAKMKENSEWRTQVDDFRTQIAEIQISRGAIL